MCKAAKSGTRISLLARLAQSGEPDQAAWEDFVDHYGGKIYQWCLQWKLQPADAQDVVQSVLLKLATRMKDFRYDPSRSFRAWLKTVTHHAWKDFADSRCRRAMPTGADDQMQSLAARENLVQHLEEAYDHELLEQAMAIVRRAAQLESVLSDGTGVSAGGGSKVAMKIARVYAAPAAFAALQEEVKASRSSDLAARPPWRATGTV